MKIAVAAPTYIPARRANTIQVMKMAQALVELDHQVHLAVPGPPPVGSRDQIWEELKRHYGLRVRFAVEWLPAHPRLRRYDYGLRSVLWARRLGADLLYTRLPQAAALGSALGMPTIFEAHDLPQGAAGPWALRIFLAGRGARRLVAITQALRADLARQHRVPEGPPFTLVAPDGVDLVRYRNLPEPSLARAMLKQAWPEPFPFPVERFTAGYTGHLYPGRGAQLLLDLAGGSPGVSFLIAGGEPPDVARMQAAARERGLANVHFTGFVPNADLPLVQAACDVLLMPYQERVAASSGGDIARYLSPMKVFEYLACGRPVLASDLPVLREVLHPENAVLLPPGDAPAWTAALRSLMASPSRRQQLAQQACRDAGQYDWTGRAARILERL